jgi:hypothetical protein
MAWLTQFLLGRPGSEYTFELNPQGMRIEESAIVVRQRNLAGDLKKSTLKISVPTIQIDSDYLTMTQRNQFHSLAGIDDTFLSFKTRTDWTQYADKASVITTTKFRLNNSSALRLSKTLTAMSLSSTIAISTITSSEAGWSSGAVTYSDSSFDVNVGVALATTTSAVYVTYTYNGWLVDMQKVSTSYRGGSGDLSSYSFELTGV